MNSDEEFFKRPVKLGEDELSIEDNEGIVLVPNIAFRYDVAHVTRQRKVAAMIVRALNHVHCEPTFKRSGR